jgi:hypothetical protein
MEIRTRNLLPIRRDGQVATGSSASGASSMGGSGGGGGENQLPVYVNASLGFYWEASTNSIRTPFNFYAGGELQAFASDPAPTSWWDSLPIASSTVLGGFKVGSNLTIDINGVLNAAGGGGGTDASWGYLVGNIVAQTDLMNYFSARDTSIAWLNSNKLAYRTFGTAANNATTDFATAAQGTDARTPTSHNNTYHSETYITSAALSSYTPIVNPTFTEDIVVIGNAYAYGNVNANRFISAIPIGYMSSSTAITAPFQVTVTSLPQSNELFYPLITNYNVLGGLGYYNMPAFGFMRPDNGGVEYNGDVVIQNSGDGLAVKRWKFKPSGTIITPNGTVALLEGPTFTGAVALGNWTIEASGTGLLFKNSGTKRIYVDSTGNAIFAGEVTGFGGI